MFSVYSKSRGTVCFYELSLSFLPPKPEGGAPKDYVHNPDGKKTYDFRNPRLSALDYVFGTDFKPVEWKQGIDSGGKLGYDGNKELGGELYPNTTLQAAPPDDGFNFLDWQDWKNLAGEAGNQLKAGFYGAAAGLIGKPLNYLAGTDQHVHILIDGDRIGVIRTGNGGEELSDGKVREKVPTAQGYTILESALTEQELAQKLGFGSVKELKLALVNADDYTKFINQGNAHSDNANQHLADQYKNTYDKAAGLTGFAASFAPGYGDGTDIVETLTGRDLRTGEKLPLWQRGVTGKPDRS